MGEIAIQFLGSGDAFGSGGRLQTCIYADTGDTRLLLDCGASSLSAMKLWGVSPSKIEIILLTHLNGDHFGGLPYFFLDAYLVSKRKERLSIAGPPGLHKRIVDAQEILFPGSSQLEPRYPIDYKEFEDKRPVVMGDLIVTPYRVVHASGSLAFALRVEYQGKVITFSGDTEWTDVLVEAAQGADLFICEVYTFEKKIKYHLDYRTLLAHLPKLTCKRMIVTHMSEDLLDRAADLDLEFAEDGKRVVI